MIFFIFSTIVFLVGEKEYHIVGSYKYEFIIKGKLNLINLYIPLPQEFEDLTTYQKLIKMEDFENLKPLRKEIVDIYGNNILKLYYRNIADTKINVEIKFECIKGFKLKAPSKEFSFQDINFERISFIDEITKEFLLVVAKNKNIFDIVNRLIYFTSKNIIYDERFREPEITFKLKRGNCSGISSLSTLFFNSIGINSRLVIGITLKDNNSKFVFVKEGTMLTFYPEVPIGQHQWIEVYYDSLGWCESDPQGLSNFVTPNYIVLFRGNNFNIAEYEFFGKKEPTIQNFITINGKITMLKDLSVVKSIFEEMNKKPVFFIEK